MNTKKSLWVTILSGINAGGGWTIDLLYSPKMSRVKEIKSHEGSEIVQTLEYSYNDFDPDNYGKYGEEFIDLIEKRYGITLSFGE